MHVPGMHTLSDCDTTSYPYSKGKVMAKEEVDTMISGKYQGLTTLGDFGTTYPEMVNAAIPAFVAFYSQPPETSMESPRFNCVHKEENC